jgi:hypothetical protein
MLHELLNRNKARIEAAAKEEIARAQKANVPAYFENPEAEGEVVRRLPDGTVEKISGYNDHAA